jgi:Uma2 family endonuclease
VELIGGRIVVKGRSPLVDRPWTPADRQRLVSAGMHPSHALLVVEVADTSLDMDRRHKGSLYARSGIAEYWIVNLPARCVELHLAPEPDPEAVFGWRYSRREVVGAEGVIMPLARAGARVAVADLLP